MKRIALLLATFLFCGATAHVQAKTMRLRDLTLDQRMALERSEDRLARFDRTLQMLETEHRKGRISKSDYFYEKNDLIAFIGCEARYQNDILIDNRPIPPEEVREVLANIAKYAILVPTYIIAAVASGMAHSGSSLSFSP